MVVHHDVVVHRTVGALDADWDAFCAHHPFAGRRWLSITENSFRDYEPRYVVVRSRGRIVAGAVVARQRHFNTSAYVSNDRLLPLARRLLHLAPPISVQVAPYGVAGVIAAAGASTGATSLVLDTIHQIARRDLAPFVGFNALESHDPVLAAAGYSFWPVGPDAVIDLTADSFAEFEQALPKKYREEIRRVRNRARRAGVEIDITDITTAPGRDIERLMLGVTEHHRNRSTYRPGLVERAAAHLDADHHRTIVGRLDGCAVATVSVFKDGPVGVLRWMGLDYPRATPAHAYHLVMTEAVGQAIDLGVRRLVLGATSYVLKKKLGAHLEDRFIGARPTSRTLGRLVLASRSAKSVLDRRREEG